MVVTHFLNALMPLYSTPLLQYYINCTSFKEWRSLLTAKLLSIWLETYTTDDVAPKTYANMMHSTELKPNPYGIRHCHVREHTMNVYARNDYEGSPDSIEHTMPPYSSSKENTRVYEIVRHRTSLRRITNWCTKYQCSMTLRRDINPTGK